MYERPREATLRFSSRKNSPKGELFQKLDGFLELQGFRVLAFNLVDMDDSDCYNPFAYIRSDNDIIKPLSLYLQAIMSYVWYECPKMGKNCL